VRASGVGAGRRGPGAWRKRRYRGTPSAPCPAGPARKGSASSLCPGNSWPWALTSWELFFCWPHRATGTCSSSRTSRQSGHLRRSSARRTQGMPSKSERTDSRSTVKNVPVTRPWSAFTISRRSTRWRSPPTTIVFRRNTGDSTSARPPAYTRRANAMAARAPAAAFTARGLSHMAAFLLEPRQLQDSQAQVLERQPRVARGHRHERVVRHPRRGVDLEEIRLARAVEHHVDATPPAASQRLEGEQRLVLNDALGVRREPAGDHVARIVRLVFRLVVVELPRR